MRDEKRFNNGYRIIESRRTGNAEIVIGHNPQAPSPYVCWYCRNSTEYLMGYYANNFMSVWNKLWERFHLDKQAEKRRRKYILQRDAGAVTRGKGDAYGN